MSEQTVYKKGIVRTLKGLVIKIQFDEDMLNLTKYSTSITKTSRRSS